MAKRFDVIIIGNGIVGLAIAHGLATRAPEMRIAIIGPAARPGAATGAAGAMLNAWCEIARDQFAWPILAERASLFIDALDLWEDACTALQPFSAAPLTPGWGTLVLDTGRGGESEKETLATTLAALAARGLDAPIDPRGRIIPDGWIDAVPVLAAYEAALRAGGAAFQDGRAIDLAPVGGEWRVTLDSGEVVGGAHVILANGPFAQDLADLLPDVAKATPRLLYEAGAGFDVSFPGGPRVTRAMRTLGRGAVGGFHIVPLGPERYYVGATAEAALTPNWGLPKERLAVTRNAFIEEGEPAFAAAAFTPRAVGFRALSADGYPLLGASRHAENLWFATGMRRDGFTSSPMLARLFAEAMIDGRIGPVLQRFAPSRKLLPYKNRAGALADACAGHGADEQQRLKTLYDACALGDFGINPSVLPLYADEKVFARLTSVSD